MRIGGPSGAAAALRRAQRSSALARRTGCPVDEADEILAGTLSRRQFLAAAGSATALASLRGRSARGPRATSPGERSSPTVVIIGSGMAGLGCADRLWRHHGIGADVYEFNTVPGGRIRTLRGYFDDDQIMEEHAEFINPEHTATLSLAASLGLSLDNTDRYPPGTHPNTELFRFGGRVWPQAALNDDWHSWGWELFHRAAFEIAPWPTLYDRSSPGGRLFDKMSVSEWIDTYVPGGIASDFGQVCIAAVLDEYGGPADEESALNLVYLLGEDDSVASDVQPRSAPQLAGANEKWHIHGGNDQLVTGVLERLPQGILHLGNRLVAVRASAVTGFVCTFEDDGATTDVAADHVVLAVPFTTLRMVDLSGVSISPLHLQAIEQEPLGTNSKLALQFSSRLWNAEHATGNTFNDTAVQGGWDTTNDQGGANGILVALPGGTSAREWGARYGLTTYLGPTPDAMARDFLAAWDQLYPGVAAAYNGLSYFVWSPGDPHILGAYSYLKVGQYTAFNGIQGQQEGNLHFAGEQTSINFQGYIEGALRSGYRCADEIAGTGSYIRALHDGGLSSVRDRE